MTELALHFSNPAILAGQPLVLESRRPSDWRWSRTAMAWERAAWKSVAAELPGGQDQPASRVYLGNEFCPYLAWSPDELVRGAAQARDAGFHITIVFCPQWERSLDGTLAAVDTLAAAHPDLEVVANDWGLLAALASRPVNAVAGRLLYKAKRNPRLSRKTLPAGLPDSGDRPEEVLQRQLAEWALLPSDAPWLKAWLQQMSASRVEVELVPQGLHCAPDNPLPIALHLPWTYITGGGQCPVAVLQESGGTTRCTRRCRTTVVETVFPTPTWPLRQAGHTVFSPMVSLLKGYAALPRIDRWVLSPGLPM